MSIRINLLAEAQAIEDLRRRDPVKRAIWGGVVLVVLMLAWSISLQLKAMIARSELSRVASQLATRTNDFQQVLVNQRKLIEANNKLILLQEMATNRMLYGTLLNALQQTTLDDVQLTRLKTDETYVYNEEIKPKTNAANAHITPGRPPNVTQKVVVTLEAKDSGPNPGDQVNKFKQTINQSPYFQAILGKASEARLVNLSPPQSLDGKPFVVFTLECRYPEITR
jgi:hypothetical protein